jgi:hypothetical protein
MPDLVLSALFGIAAGCVAVFVLAAVFTGALEDWWAGIVDVVLWPIRRWRA